MSRHQVREMKRAAIGVLPGAQPEEGLRARDAAIWLLERSINFGHGRLAVIRLAKAVEVGADVRREHWAYCRSVLGKLGNETLEVLYKSAAHAAAGRAVYTTACFQ